MAASHIALNRFGLGAGHTTVDPGPSRTWALHSRLDALMTDETSRIYQAGLHVVAFEPRVLPEEIIDRVSGRQHPEDVLHRQAPAPNDRLAAEDARINSDPAQEGVLLNLCHCRYPF